MNFKTLAIIFALFITRAGYSASISISESPAPDRIPLVANNRPAEILIDPHDAKVVSIAANLLAEDIERVTGQKPAISTELNAKDEIVIIIGIAGQSQLIDNLVANHKVDISSIRGKWEAYLITAVSNPAPNINKAIVITGSDRRGTAFGVFTLSQAIGVSPWYFWADVPPQKKSQLYVSLPQPVTDFPRVKYRGIFINDEDWGLLPWATNTFDTEAHSIGPKTYAKVFELMLRLKANYLWPAMHPRTRAFNYFPQNKQLVDDYAIVMSSSHAEPMLRNNTSEYDIKTRGPWDYDKNRDNILAYWDQRLKENGQFENVYTIGMRGIHDSAMPGGGTLSEKVARLQRVIDDQRNLLARDVSRNTVASPATGGSDQQAAKLKLIPQQFVPYKEVLPLYQHGLKVPDDVTLVWPDDNFGYIRRLSTPEEQKRTGGAGIYYHLSYYGPPEDYLWLESTPPALIWEEMTRAYEYGARTTWVVNVGDIKPAEKGITFFLNLAWNPKQYDENCQLAFLKDFANRTFGPDLSNEVASIWDEYYRLNFYPRPEHTPYANFTWTDSEKRLEQFATLVARANSLYERMPPDLRDACYELLVYPVRCSAAMNEKQLCTAHWRELHAKNLSGAEAFHDRALAAQKVMDSETSYYNDRVAGGKWKHIISDKQRGEIPFREPDLTFKKPKEMADVHLDPPLQVENVVSISAAHPTRATDSSELKWTTIPGLGSTGNCIAAYPTTRTQPRARDSEKLWPSIPDNATPDQLSKLLPSLHFEFSTTHSGNALIAVNCLPTHAIDDCHHLRYAISIDNHPPEVIDIDSLEFSPQWKKNVLRNLAIGESKANINAGEHTLTLWPLDPAVVFDKLTIDQR